jgi:hypothetical protein
VLLACASGYFRASTLQTAASQPDGQLALAPVVQLPGLLGGAHDIGEQHDGEHPVGSAAPGRQSGFLDVIQGQVRRLQHNDSSALSLR